MRSITNAIIAYASKLKFPQLFYLSLLLFLVDLAVPDFIPFIDEILLGLMTMMFGFWKKRKSEKVSINKLKEE